MGLAGSFFVALNGPSAEHSPQNLTPVPIEFAVLATRQSVQPQTPSGQRKGTSRPMSSPKVTRPSVHPVREPAPIASPAPQESPPPPVTVENQTAPATKPRYILGSPECPHPRYPKEARRRGLSGRVVVRLFVRKDGTVEAAEVYESSGHPLLDQAAQETLKEWRLQPASYKGVASTSTVDIPIRFELVAP